MPTDPRTWLGIALVLGVGGFVVGGVIAALRGTGGDAASIAAVSTLLGAIAVGVIGKRDGE